MAASNNCPECGSPLGEERQGHLCPKCLLKVGMGSQPEEGGQGTVSMEGGGARVRRMPEPGEHFGAYRINRVLGRGGMGAVYDAEDLESGRRVALKVLSRSLDSPEARKRFLREGRMAGSINHPNSVYVFGTEEIDGTPAISMELVSGGTLQDGVREKGVMAVAEAVDTILQVIAGLEAAQAIGILHRDIKPANCFVDSYGTVKIGDFGLSISTAARAESNLTVTGSFMGTPAFSSPEQIRGEELNIRSDIYAVGVTLYYLLTGRPPFSSENVVQLLATILEKPAESPSRWRKEIPKTLCRLILRCLEKQPTERFNNYVELRNALLPFASTTPTTASPGLRFLAAVLDISLLCLPWFLIGWLVLDDWPLIDPTSSKMMILSLASTLTLLLYYGILEGVWGASLGKRILRLRVIGLDRNLPGFPKAVLRALIYVMMPMLPMWIYFGLVSDPLTSYGSRPSMAMNYAYYGVMGLMFSTARRRNGFAGFHDLASKTRVVLKPAFQPRPLLQAQEEPPATGEMTRQIGPYYVLQTLDRTEEAELLLAYDTRLLRKVWVRKLPPGTPPIPPALRNLARVGRLRWLSGQRGETECWDAYEAVPGQPLLNLLDQEQSWGWVRFWLLDLAQELNAATPAQPLPQVLSLDRIWITEAGQAKLLDFPAPGSRPIAGGSEAAASDQMGPAEFLKRVAVTALEGRIVGADPAEDQHVRCPLPLKASALLSDLPKQCDLVQLVDRLKPLLHRASSVSRLRRAGLLAASAALPLVAIIGLLLSTLIIAQWAKKQPELDPLWSSLVRLQQLQAKGSPPGKLEEKNAFETYLAGRFRQVVTNPLTWTTLYSRSFITPEQKQLAEELVEKLPPPSESEMRRVATIVEPHLKQTSLVRSVRQMAGSTLGQMVLILFLIYVAIPALIAALLFRGGLLFLLAGIAVVRKDGARASRWRVFWRSLISWSPLILASFLVFWIHWRHPAWAWATPVALLLPISLGGWSALLTRRSLQDCLAGTALVPR